MVVAQLAARFIPLTAAVQTWRRSKSPRDLMLAGRSGGRVPHAGLGRVGGVQIGGPPYGREDVLLRVAKGQAGKNPARRGRAPHSPPGGGTSGRLNLLPGRVLLTMSFAGRGLAVGTCTGRPPAPHR